MGKCPLDFCGLVRIGAPVLRYRWPRNTTPLIDYSGGVPGFSGGFITFEVEHLPILISRGVFHPG